MTPKLRSKTVAQKAEDVEAVRKRDAKDKTQQSQKVASKTPACVQFKGVVNPDDDWEEVKASKVDTNDLRVSSGDSAFKNTVNIVKEHEKLLDEITCYKLDASHVNDQDKFLEFHRYEKWSAVGRSSNFKVISGLALSWVITLSSFTLTWRTLFTLKVWNLI